MEVSSNFTWDQRRALSRAHYTASDRFLFGKMKLCRALTYSTGIWKAWAALCYHLSLSLKEWNPRTLEDNWCHQLTPSLCYSWGGNLNTTGVYPQSAGDLHSLTPLGFYNSPMEELWWAPTPPTRNIPKHCSSHPSISYCDARCKSGVP